MCGGVDLKRRFNRAILSSCKEAQIKIKMAEGFWAGAGGGSEGVRENGGTWHSRDVRRLRTSAVERIKGAATFTQGLPHSSDKEAWLLWWLCG